MVTTKNRRALQITLGVLSAIPALSGGAGVLVGHRALPGPDRSVVEPSLDSEYRVTSAFFLAAAPVIWASIPKVEQAAAPLRVLAAAGFVGGIGRLLSWRTTGRPHPAFIAATVLELVGMPALVLWQEQVRRATA
ncbi:DUF4345 domain-containing protein [Pseudonocardia sp. CA-107938]|uniref:DUF4345 domain-containing protein n=1 Tax=Pseudonocardia sp. CA-107938 TaxID=3240021 RepID=UPI003D8CFB9C